jgi:hypothetical protein
MQVKSPPLVSLKVSYIFSLTVNLFVSVPDASRDAAEAGLSAAKKIKIASQRALLAARHAAFERLHIVAMLSHGKGTLLFDFKQPRARYPDGRGWGGLPRLPSPQKDKQLSVCLSGPCALPPTQLVQCKAAKRFLFSQIPNMARHTIPSAKTTVFVSNNENAAPGMSDDERLMVMTDAEVEQIQVRFRARYGQEAQILTRHGIDKPPASAACGATDETPTHVIC